jgi:hypothetical protein
MDYPARSSRSRSQAWLGGFLGRVGGGDLRLDLAGVGSPVADGRGHQVQRYPVLSLTKLTRSSLFSPGSVA